MSKPTLRQQAEAIKIILDSGAVGLAASRGTMRRAEMALLEERLKAARMTILDMATAEDEAAAHIGNWRGRI